MLFWGKLKIKVSRSELEFLFQKDPWGEWWEQGGVTLELGPHIVAGEAIRWVEGRGTEANEEQIEVHVGRCRLCQEQSVSAWSAGCCGVGPAGEA